MAQCNQCENIRGMMGDPPNTEQANHDIRTFWGIYREAKCGPNKRICLPLLKLYKQAGELMVQEEDVTISRVRGR